MLEIIADHIKHGAFQMIKHLDLHGIRSTNDQLGAIGDSFANAQDRYSPLKTLILRGNELTHAGVGKLMQAMSLQVGGAGLTRLRELEALDISRNEKVSKSTK